MASTNVPKRDPMSNACMTSKDKPVNSDTAVCVGVKIIRNVL